MTDANTAKGVSLSFGANSSSHRTKRVKVNEDDEDRAQEFLTGFSERGAVFRDSDRGVVVVDGDVKRIIPTQGNDFRGLGPKAFNPNRHALSPGITNFNFHKPVQTTHPLYTYA